jgi:hypothetical protein
MNDGKTILLTVWACVAVLVIIIHAGPGKTAAMKSTQPPIPRAGGLRASERRGQFAFKQRDFGRSQVFQNDWIQVPWSPDTCRRRVETSTLSSAVAILAI